MSSVAAYLNVTTVVGRFSDEFAMTEGLDPQAVVVVSIVPSYARKAVVIPCSGTRCTCQTYMLGASRGTPTCAHVAVADALLASGGAIGLSSSKMLESVPPEVALMLPGTEAKLAELLNFRAFDDPSKPLPDWLEKPGASSGGLARSEQTDDMLMKLMRHGVHNKPFVDGADITKLVSLKSDVPVTAEDVLLKLRARVPLVVPADSGVSVEASGEFPPEDEFYIPSALKRQLLFCASVSEHVMLVGGAGSGKSELAALLAKATGRPFFAFNLGGVSEARGSLVGNMAFTDEGTKFVRSSFLTAIQTPNALVLLDEVSRAGDAPNLLLPLMDRQRRITIDEEGGTEIRLADGVMFVGTANVGMQYTGTRAMDRALLDRMCQYEIGYPPLAAETLLLSKRTGLKTDVAARLARVADKQRKAATEDSVYSNVISTRALLRCASQIASGKIQPLEAFEYCVATVVFSKEGGKDSEFAQLMALARTELASVRS